MKISEQWLSEWVPDLEGHSLPTLLTNAGFEVEECSAAAGEFSDVVIGSIETITPHPDADRLRICTVSIGQEKPLSIVCGAANPYVGLKVAVAQIGAKLPDFTIKLAKLRGVVSEGMLCSGAELGMGELNEGILELPPNAPLGKNLREWLQLEDKILEINVTPNRGDCLSVVGMAREVAAITRLALVTPEFTSPPFVPTLVKKQINVLAKQDCPIYVGREIRNISSPLDTPIYIKERLRRSGFRCIAPVVDILNYVMLELGQPLHAFDADVLEGGITVRKAQSHENLLLLDNRKVALSEETLIIADEKKPLAIAGIMGGLESGVSKETRNIFIESAFFTPRSVAGKARYYNLHSEAAYRFERGVAPLLQEYALERATQLLIEIVGGEAGPIVDCISLNFVPPLKTVTLRHNAVARTLGMAITDAEIEDILQRLGFQLHPEEGGWRVSIPSRRFDVSLEEDLIEEVARIKGYANIKSKPPIEVLSPLEETKTSSFISDYLRDRGYSEIITYSFVDPKLQNLLTPHLKSLKLMNPISPEMSVMRTTLWTGLLNTLSYNLNRQQNRLRLFEMGVCFCNTQEAPNSISEDIKFLDIPKVAGCIAGNFLPEQWAEKSRPVDFYDIKGDIENLLQFHFSLSKIKWVATEHSALHPGQTAAIMVDDKILGIAGKLNPEIAKILNFSLPIYLFELSLESFLQQSVPKIRVISKFPTIRRDLAFYIDNEISCDQVLKVVHDSAGEYVVDINIFDVYHNKESDPNKKSLAIAITLQHPSRTLVDEEINSIIEKIINALEQQFSIILRK